MIARRVLLTLLIVLTVLVACATAPRVGGLRGPDFLPDKALPIKPTPPLYRQWWKDVEGCAGARKPVHRARFFFIAAPDGDGFRHPWFTDPLDGLAFPPRQWMAVASYAVLDSMTVRHEMLHLIASEGYHNPDLYQRRCKGLVWCYGSCLTDTLPPRLGNRFTDAEIIPEPANNG